MDSPDVATNIRMALSCLSGVLPRRAIVLNDNTICDKVVDPSRPELLPVSVVCEILRQSANETVHPRFTPQLLTHCLNTNDPDAWRAMLDDAVTGDLDAASMAAFWGNTDNTDQLVQCLVNAQPGMHMWLIIRAMQYVLPCIDPTGALKMGGAFQRMFPDIVRSLSRRAKDISADMKAGAISTLGKMMVWCDIPTANLCDMLNLVLSCPTEDAMCLFLFAPLQQLAAHDPLLADKILQRAERSSQAARYPPCALLAVLSAEHLLPLGERVLKLVQKTLDTAAAQGCIDARLALACGVLAKSTTPRKSLDASLAHALCCMAISNTSNTV